MGSSGATFMYQTSIATKCTPLGMKTPQSRQGENFCHFWVDFVFDSGLILCSFRSYDSASLFPSRTGHQRQRHSQAHSCFPQNGTAPQVPLHHRGGMEGRSKVCGTPRACDAPPLGIGPNRPGRTERRSPRLPFFRSLPYLETI
jgi:hypothetical protein